MCQLLAKEVDAKPEQILGRIDWHYRPSVADEKR